VLATATAAVSNKIQSVISAAKTAVFKINVIKVLISRNCLLKIKQFYVSFSNYTKYNNWPLNISNIIPETITSFIDDKVQFF
jgi:hypothetical protein